MKVFLLSTAVVLLLSGHVYGGELFTQEASCDLAPNFDGPVKPASGTSPFRIQLSSTTYKNEEPITITISSTDGDEFINAIVRTHCISCTDPRTDLGTFTEVDERLEKFDCGDTEDSVVTAASYKGKRQLKIMWTPAPSLKEKLVIEGTVIVALDEWWNKLMSETLMPASSASSYTQGPILASSGTVILFCLALCIQE